MYGLYEAFRPSVSLLPPALAGARVRLRRGMRASCAGALLREWTRGLLRSLSRAGHPRAGVRKGARGWLRTRPPVRGHRRERWILSSLGEPQASARAERSGPKPLSRSETGFSATPLGSLTPEA